MCTEELDRIVEYRGRRGWRGRRKKVGDKNNNNNDKMEYIYRN